MKLTEKEFHWLSVLVDRHGAKEVIKAAVLAELRDDPIATKMMRFARVEIKPVAAQKE